MAFNSAATASVGTEAAGRRSDHQQVDPRHEFRLSLIHVQELCGCPGAESLEERPGDLLGVPEDRIVDDQRIHGAPVPGLRSG
jgi:hypothetical protein